MIAMDYGLGPTFFGRGLEGALSEGPAPPSGSIIALWRSSPLGCLKYSIRLFMNTGLTSAHTIGAGQQPPLSSRSSIFLL